jgi:hypothetical protein
VEGVNQRIGYSAVFETEEHALAFSAALPQPSQYEIQRPDEDYDQWLVNVRGPWDDHEEGEAIIEALATEHHGTYDATEDI